MNRYDVVMGRTKVLGVKKRPTILSRLQRGLAAVRSARSGDSSLPAAGKPEYFAFSAEIPGLSQSKPLWRIAVEMNTQPQGDGEQLSLRVHWQANLSSGLALDAPRAGSANSSSSVVAARVGDFMRAGLSQPLVRQLAKPFLQHDFSSWMEIRASSADLADGTRALLPQRERLQALGVELPEGDGPITQTWAATPGSQPGFAQLSLLRLDKKHLPPALATLLGSRPFQLAAAIVNVIEPKSKS